MNLDELRTVQSKERSKDSLQHLRESFYADVADYIADLKDQRDRAAERADSPFDDPEVERLTDEINTAEDVVEAIYERRVGKIVKRASLAAAGMPADEDGLTSEEQELFGELVDRIEENKQDVLDILAGEADPVDSTPTPTPADAESGTESTPDPGRGAPAEEATPDPGEPPGASADSSDASDSGEDVSAADVMGGDDATDAASGSTGSGAGATADDDARPGAAEATAVADDPDSGQSSASDAEASPAASDDDAEVESEDPMAGLDERTTIRITDDVGEIFGVDERTYDLESEDVVTLPEANAEPLVERGAAEKLE